MQRAAFYRVVAGAEFQDGAVILIRIIHRLFQTDLCDMWQVLHNQANNNC